jgi:hypothetical protein
VARREAGGVIVREPALEKRAGLNFVLALFCTQKLSIILKITLTASVVS